jgi:hypothetical protein
MTHPNDELLPADRAQIETMRPDRRARALLDHRRAQKARQARREATERVVASGGVRFLEAQALAAEVAAVSVRPEVLALCLMKPEFARRVEALRQRAGNQVLVAAATMNQPSAPRRGFEHLDPAEFARRVQIRRRRDALMKRKASR